MDIWCQYENLKWCQDLHTNLDVSSRHARKVKWKVTGCNCLALPGGKCLALAFSINGKEKKDS